MDEAADESEASKLIHVYPTFGRPHVLLGYTCWCRPEIDAENDRVVIHHEEN